MTDLVVAPGRQGPGRLSASAVARIDIGLRRRAAGVLAGDHLTSGLGSGTEIAQLRPYEAGDDPRRLDPAASARTGVPHVRLQVPEQAITTWLVLDVSPSMAYGTQGRLKSDVAEGVAEVVGRLAIRRGGRIAAVTGGSAQPRLLPPRGGRGALAGVRALVGAGVAADGTAPDRALGRALTRVVRLARTRGVIVVVSDFREEGWEGPLRTAAARHTVQAIEVVDPSEAVLADAGHLVVVDPETGSQTEADTASSELRETYAATEAARRAHVATLLRRAGARHTVLSTERDWLRDLGRGLR